MSHKQDYSPVKLPRSPGLNYVGNLTGHPRKVKDSAADCFNWYLEWKQLDMDGIEVLNKISSIRMKSFSNEPQGYSVELEKLGERLQGIVRDLEEVVAKMHVLCEQSRAMVELVKLEGRHTEPWFLSWPPERFHDTYLMFTSNLEDELRMKRTICERVCHVSSRDLMKMLVAMWKYSIYLHPKFEVRMDALLMETGHKPY